MTGTSTAETVGRQSTDATTERYAHSLSTIKQLGATAAKGSMAYERRDVIYELAFGDFETAVTEMLKTDPEFRSQLDIDKIKTYQIIGGMACKADGGPMVAMIEEGYKCSSQMANDQPEFRAQAVRDWYDLENARLVDKLQPGQSRIVLCMDPKDELKIHNKTYTKLGYKGGLAYLQSYTKADKNTLVVGSYSVDRSDLEVWRELFANIDITVPANESPNTWIRNAIELQASPEESEAFVRSLRDEYYRRIGEGNSKSSITAYVQNNEAIVRQFFDHYYFSLGQGVCTGRNNERLQSFARAILQTDISNVKPEIIQRLIRMSNSQKFDNDSAELIDSMVRYAVVEELRKGLERASRNQKVTGFESLVGDHYTTNICPMNQHEVHLILSQNIETGTRAQRTYGGCAGQIELNKQLANEGLNADDSRQEAFGGKDREGADTTTGTIRCIKCRKMVEKAKVVKKDCWECPACNHKIDVCTGETLREGNIIAKRDTIAKHVTLLFGKKSEKMIKTDNSEKLSKVA